MDRWEAPQYFDEDGSSHHITPQHLAGWLEWFFSITRPGRGSVGAKLVTHCREFPGATAQLRYKVPYLSRTGYIYLNQPAAIPTPRRRAVGG